MSESSERARRATGLFSFVRMFERVGGMKSIGVRGARAMGNSRTHPPALAPIREGSRGGGGAGDCRGESKGAASHCAGSGQPMVVRVRMSEVGPVLGLVVPPVSAQG